MEVQNQDVCIALETRYVWMIGTIPVRCNLWEPGVGVISTRMLVTILVDKESGFVMGHYVATWFNATVVNEGLREAIHKFKTKPLLLEVHDPEHIERDAVQLPAPATMTQRYDRLGLVAVADWAIQELRGLNGCNFVEANEFDEAVREAIESHNFNTQGRVESPAQCFNYKDN